MNEETDQLENKHQIGDESDSKNRIFVKWHDLLQKWKQLNELRNKNDSSKASLSLTSNNYPKFKRISGITLLLLSDTR